MESIWFRATSLLESPLVMKKLTSTFSKKIVSFVSGTELDMFRKKDIVFVCI